MHAKTGLTKERRKSFVMYYSKEYRNNAAKNSVRIEVTKQRERMNQIIILTFITVQNYIRKKAIFKSKLKFKID